MPNATPFASGLTVTFFTPNSGNSNINAIVTGEKWGGAIGTGIGITYSFPTSGAVWKPSYSANNEPAGFTTFTAAQAASFRAQLQAWGNVANINFSEVADTPTLVGDIRVALSPAVQASASFGWAYFPSTSAVGGDIWFSPSSMAAIVPVPGDYAFQAGIHEIGHALGLDHPLGNGAQAGFTAQQTIMSYNGWANSLFRTVVAQPGGGFSGSYKYIYTDTPSVLDVAALQYTYGASTKFNAGNDYTGGQDVIELSAAIFTVYAGQIGSYVTTSAFLSYSSTTGILAYDADGAGAGAPLTVAILGVTNHPTLLGNDFLIIA